LGKAFTAQDALTYRTDILGRLGLHRLEHRQRVGVKRVHYRLGSRRAESQAGLHINVEETWMLTESHFQQVDNVDHRSVGLLAFVAVICQEPTLVGVQQLWCQVVQAEPIRGPRFCSGNESYKAAYPAQDHVERARRSLSTIFADYGTQRLGQPTDQPRAGQGRQVDLTVETTQPHSEHDWADGWQSRIVGRSLPDSRESHSAPSPGAHSVTAAPDASNAIA